MNERLHHAAGIAAASLQGDDPWQLVQRVLTSPPFVKAPRMCSLLSFLMGRTLAGLEASISEHEIGIEVFRRDARDFDTTTDPIVRVQMGRLRDRLAQYNATCTPLAGQQIEIPPGSYVPQMTPCQGGLPARRIGVELAPLRQLGADGANAPFAEGQAEELTQRMFRQFAAGRGAAPDFRLEISLRVEHRRTRASLRLIDVHAAGTVWMHQCDREGDLAIALQEALALDICTNLQAYLDGCQSADTPPGGRWLRQA